MVKKVDIEQAQSDVSEARAELKICKKKRCKSEGQLGEHVAIVLAWAFQPKASKQILAWLVKRHLNISVTTDQIYCFVRRHNNGVWPNSEKKRPGGGK